LLAVRFFKLEIMYQFALRTKRSLPNKDGYKFVAVMKDLTFLLKTVVKLENGLHTVEDYVNIKYCIPISEINRSGKMYLYNKKQILDYQENTVLLAEQWQEIIGRKAPLNTLSISDLEWFGVVSVN